MTAYTAKNKVLMFSLFMLGYTILYIYPNIRPPFPPAYLPLFSVDQAIPLVPWTFFIYLSDYALFLVAVIIVNDAPTFRSMSRKCFEVLVVCGAFFLFFPTRYPRPEYPTVTSPVLAFVMNLIASADTPNNCFPSMHVALTGIATWSLRHKGPRLFGIFTIWTLAIFISTLTTKQHYLLDVLGGSAVIAAVAAFDWAFFETGYFRGWLSRKEPALGRFFSDRE